MPAFTPEPLGEQMEMGTSEKDDLDDIDPAEIKAALERGVEGRTSPITEMIRAAAQQAEDYHTAIEEAADFGFIGGELGDMQNQNAIQPQFAEEAAELRIPQFFLKTVPDLFGDEYELLERENLSDGFSLSGQDAQISFELATGEMYRVDLQEQGEAIPKYKRASKEESEYIRERLAKMPPEKRNLIDIVVGLGNVKWWHRIIERKGFRINGNINHYSDFMVMTKFGKLVLIEFKGDDRDNSDSKTKLELGRQWQAQVGQNDRYFMVFKNKESGIGGAYSLDQFAEIIKEL